MTPLPQNSMIQGRYLIVQMIGSGSSGEVYLAVDQWSGSAVAVKRTLVLQDIEAAASRLKELRHAVLPKVNDVFTADGSVYLVTEHITGENLDRRLDDAKKPFPLSWCMFWADQVLDALNYLHSHTPPIVHGDIKPANLKLTDENHIVLLDLGLGVIPPEVAETDRKRDPYAAVEFLRDRQLSPESDMYSVAATFYQLMTDAVPPDSRKRSDAVRSGLPDPLVPLSKANPEIPAEISEVLMKGLDLSPGSRYQAAAAMQRELRRAYKKNRESMSAPTVAFKRPDEPTAAMNEPVPDNADADTLEGTISGGEIETKTHVSTVAQEPAPTVVMPAPPVTAVPQGQIKTEEYPSGSMATPANETVPATPLAAATEPVRKTMSAAAGAPAVSAPKKGSSKTGVIIGVLAVLLVLGVAGGVGGWYAYKHYYAAAAPTPTPAPSPSPITSPSPTPMLAVDTNATTPNNNSAVSGTNTADANANRAVATTSTPGQVPVKSAPAAPVKPGPVRVPSQPAARPSAKPKAGDDRTVILQ